ncbi:MAG: baseplate J/gp47 family protein [Acetobacteraceae bacterium]
MQLSLQTFNSLVQNMAAAVQSSASQLMDLTVGSVTRAILEANASVALWMQWLILQVLQSTRAATSNGADLDSWMADMTLVRLPAVAATGAVNFSRYTPLAPALVPSGALVRTADGSQTYSVTADTSNTAWAPAQSGYVMAAGVGSVTVPIAAQVPGAAGNVQAGVVTLLVTAIPGVDLVVNPAPVQNGLDAESDSALRLRFQNFLQSRSRATTVAVTYAVSTIQQGLTCVVQENVDAAGDTLMGNFVITVDDGTGNPPVALLGTAQAAVDAVRPVGSSFTVQPPTVTIANISLTISVASPATTTQIIPAVSNAIATYVNSLPIGGPLPITKLAQIAYSASPTIDNVGQLLVNAGTTDITVPLSGVIKAGLVAVN